MHTTDTSEKGLETIIEKHLIENNGYVKGEHYDPKHAIDAKQLFDFIKATQPKAYEAIAKRGQHQFIHRLTSQIQQKGIIEMLRKGVKDLDVKVWLYYPKPASDLNEKAGKNYQANIFSVQRQVYYSEINRKSLDMVLFINGLPFVTMELKNRWTGQSVKNAMVQYQNDRDPKEPIFAFGRCMVHFAADDELVYMTTHLRGKQTLFLPFNKGNNDGAGNPLNPKGIKTAYLWEEIAAKESLSNIIENYVQIVEEKEGGKIKRKLIFPRYHQLRVVRRLLDDAQGQGAGKRYLIQHSAGSGKSNSITWLAHQLVSLHDKTNRAIFDSIIVVTDRKVLDKQIRDNIKQFATVKGVVEAIEAGSRQLKQALEDGKKIIITTVQKFPFIMEEIGVLKAKNFAIIIDEAHSSQSGETAGKMNWILSDKRENYLEDVTSEDFINDLIEQRKMLKNGSYFAFTATPKNKTLETFGRKNEEGQFIAFDNYSMKQAIEEGFILDVLRNYTTYQSNYKLIKSIADNPKFDVKEANKTLKRHVESLTIGKKTEVMIAHFHTCVAKRIRGKAKAMVVCQRIKNAIHYYQAFNAYLKAHNLPYKAIIAFSGTKDIDGIPTTEARLNGFSSVEIPEKFKTSAYRFLIVANKFQTGFDEPLLHTMYVDKKLAGVQAVQTLSRLNRTYKPDKTDTFVLDFYNDTDDIKTAFDPFYKTTVLSEATDANQLHDLADALDGAQVYTMDEVLCFTDLYFKESNRKRLDPIINTCSSRFKEDLTEQEQDHFYNSAVAFFRIYAFLSKILPFNNPYWERLYWFLKFLIPKIYAPAATPDVSNLLEAIQLDSYRLEHVSKGSIRPDGEKVLTPITPVDGRESESEQTAIDKIIKAFNERFGIDNWTDDDKVKQFLFYQLPKAVFADKSIINTIKNSDKQNAQITANEKVAVLMQQALTEYTDLYNKFSNQEEFRKEYENFVFEKIWKQVHQSPPAGLI